MTAFETNHTVPLGSVSTLRVVNIVERAYDAYLGWRKARRTETALGKLSDQQLADIGVQRGDIALIAEGLAARV
ncbi:MAG: DUF1127 domain-containing protein [Amaricoccus sp.]